MGMFDDLFDDTPDSSITENLESALEAIAQSAQRFALQTADGRSRDKLVRAWVNAQSVVVQVEIDEDLFAKSSLIEIQKATVEAAQAAAAAMKEKSAEFQTETWHQVAQDLGTSTEPTADLSMLDKLRPSAPLSPPDAPERRTIEFPATQADGRGDESGEWRLRVSD
ncbi:YbaB/EbfC family nucleoid-associated protein [Mycobacteroides salmoniphilum]|uniref:YbaB/EbfC family nucleoid-associated protein n=1 Tax=Mycobacteroides salmoniphilum TaxID=404941 RepID=UPI00356AFB46